MTARESGTADRDAAVEMQVGLVVAALDPGGVTGGEPGGAPVDIDDGKHSPEDLLRYIETLGDITRAAGELQSQAVLSAHAAGVSWAKIGERLGVSRQAVQQRFDPRYRSAAATGGSGDGVGDGAETRVLGPVSRGEELHHLNAAGAQGWRLVRSGHGEHVLRRTDTSWEVCRASVLSPKRLPSADDGWIAAATRFPDCFYVRPVR